MGVIVNKAKPIPSIGTWYDCDNFSEVFEVVAMDEDLDSIDVQFFSGEIEEFDKTYWHSLVHLSEIPQPEDMSGAYELNPEDQPEYTDVIPALIDFSELQDLYHK